MLFGKITEDFGVKKFNFGVQKFNFGSLDVVIMVFFLRGLFKGIQGNFELGFYVSGGKWLDTDLAEFCGLVLRFFSQIQHIFELNTHVSFVLQTQGVRVGLGLHLKQDFVRGRGFCVFIIFRCLHYFHVLKVLRV